MPTIEQKNALPPKIGREEKHLHIWINRALTALRNCPVDILVGILDIASLAMDTVLIVDHKSCIFGFRFLAKRDGVTV